MNWNKRTRHFGDVIEGETLSFTFLYYGDKEYEKHSVGCGCITQHDWNDNKLTIQWKSRDIPTHALQQGDNHYQASKTIAVFFKDKTIVRLYLKAVVYEKE